jgi:hypothetical protein
LHGEGFSISSRSKYEGKWGKNGVFDQGVKNFHSSNESDVLNMIDKQKLTCDDNEKRVKNDQKTGVQKGSKMVKNGGPKKGQKWPKKRVFRARKKVVNKTTS